jgi:acyl-CoA reductase-like NAD-dependent aldehyde dehydrogenase
MTQTKLKEDVARTIEPRFDGRARVTVSKAYKMYIGGAFVRSESGRYFQVNGQATGSADPATVNVPLGSRKDGRDAVKAAKDAHEGWARRTAFNRGQILYRLAEMMESRRSELVTSVRRHGVSDSDAEAEVDASIDRVVFYAGFADKFQALVASSNPVAGPHFGFSVPEPMGVIAVIAPPSPSLFGIVSTVLPVITGGNTVVALASEEDPRSALVWAECIATSDMPGGVVNVLTGRAKEVAPHLARHREVIGIDAWLADEKLRAEIENLGADNVKRIKTHAIANVDWSSEQGLGPIERFLETKTVWHPVGV